MTEFSEGYKAILASLYEQKQAAESSLTGLDVVQDRINIRESTSVLPLLADVSIEQVSIAGVPCDKVGSELQQGQRTLLYIHGGGFVVCGPDTHRNISTRMAKLLGAQVIVPDYRMAPEDVFPAAIDDCFAIYCKLVAEVGANNIVLAGDSAGGNLVANVMLRSRDEGLQQPAGAYMLSPWTDLAGTGASVQALAEKDPTLSEDGLGTFAELYLGDIDHSTPYASVLTAESFAGLANSLIQVGELEILLDDATRLHDLLQRGGSQSTLNVSEGMWHVWQIYAGMFPEADAALEEGAKFLSACLGD